jgi:hypothetical protein
MDPGPMEKKDLIWLNMIDLDIDERLTQLRTDWVGGLLLVTMVVNEDGTKSPPFVLIVAAPSAATLIFTKSMYENGVFYEDVWDT